MQVAIYQTIWHHTLVFILTATIRLLNKTADNIYTTHNITSLKISNTRNINEAYEQYLARIGL